MPESDILLSIDGDTSYLKTSLKNTLKWYEKEAAVYMKMTGKKIDIAKGLKIPQISTPIDPFAHFRKTRGKMRGMDISPRIPVGKLPDYKARNPFEFYRQQKTQTGKLGVGGGKTDDPTKKSVFGAFKGVAKLYKIDLYWRWIKGTWNSMVRNNALLKALGSIFDAAINLLGMALLLPIFKPLLDAVVWLLNKSIEFFNYMKNLEGLSPSKIAEKIVADINKFFTDTDWEEYGNRIGKKFSEIIDSIKGTDIGTLIGNGINAAIKFVTGMFDGVDWVNFGKQIGDTIYGTLKSIDWIDVGTLIAKAIWSAIKVLWGFGWSIGSKLAEMKKSGIPMPFANGGIVYGPTQALIGEAGPEMVIPLDKVGSFGGTNITVSGLVDENKFRSIIREEFNKMQGRLSRNRGAVSI